MNSFPRFASVLLVLSVLSLLTVCGFPAYGNAKVTDQFAKLSKVGFGELPSDVQERLRQVEVDCRAPENEVRRHSFAFALDANGDFKTDFIHEPGQGIKSWPDGLGGYCSANGTWLILWVSNAKGGFDEIPLDQTVAVLKSKDGFLFTHICAGDMSTPSISLAVLDRDVSKLISFGRCYGSATEAIAAAKARGYRVVSFRDP